MKEVFTSARKPVLYFLFWVVGLAIPLILVLLWDNAPRYKAVRALRTAGIAQTTESLHSAIDRGDLEVVRLLSVARVPFQEKDAIGRTPVIHAITARQSEILDFMTQEIAVDFDEADHTGTPPLAYAIAEGDLGAVKKLLLRIKNPNVMVSRDAQPPVHALLKAINERDGTLLSLLLTHPNIDVDFKDELGKTPLHYAVEQQDLLVAEALLSGKRGPNPNIPDASGDTPLDLVLRDARPEAVDLLLRHKAKIGEDHEALAMFTALENRDSDSLRLLLESGLSASLKVPNSRLTLLQYAIDNGIANCTYELLVNGADAENALRLAIQCGDAQAAHLVIAHQQNKGAVSGADQEGLLEMAIYSGNPRCMDILLENGANPNQMTSVGQRILPVAIAAAADGAAMSLIHYGAEVEFEMDHPVAPEFLDFFSERSRTRYYLTKDYGITPLMMACLMEREQVVRALLDNGAKSGSFSKRYKRYPVAFAAEQSNVPIMQMVLGRRAGDETRKAVVSLSKQKVTIYENGEPVVTSEVSSGKRGFRTPPGRYVITNKYREWNSTIYGSSMPYFMRLSCGSIGFHSGAIPGYAASHGCVRLPYSKAKLLFSMMQVGDPVDIEP